MCQRNHHAFSSLYSSSDSTRMGDFGQNQTSAPEEYKAPKTARLLQESYSDPSQWRGYKFNGKIIRYPDSDPKIMKEALWTDYRFNPSEVLPSVVFDDKCLGIGKDVGKLCQEGQLKAALQIVDFMVQRGIGVSINIYASLLQGCIQMKFLAEGKQIHTHINKSGFESNIFLKNTLVNMYAKCGSVLDARQVFDKIPKHAVFSWTAIISAYAKQGQGQEAVNLFQQMQQAGVAPNKVIFVAVLKACASLRALQWGKQVHFSIINHGLESDVVVGNTLIHMYAKCRSIEDAHKVFNKMRQRNVVSWNALIAGCAQQGLGEEVLSLFQRMQGEGMKPNKVTLISILKACTNLAALEQGKQVHASIIKSGFESDVFVGNTLIDMYAKCGSIEDACQVFNKMHERDVVSWNVMIAGYARKGSSKEVLTLFEKMQLEGVKPDSATFVSILKACASLAALEWGKQVHAHIIKNNLESDLFVESTLVDMYAKCGVMEYARRVFSKMSKRNVVSCNAMIAGYVQQGCGDEAFTLFEDMQREGMKPDNISFVSILKACASLASLPRGKQVHAHFIYSGLELNASVGSSLIDMYAKCGSIEDARRVFNALNERDVVSWTAMIAGYAQQGHAEEALSLFEQMQQEGVKPDIITFVSVLKACTSLVALEWGKQVHTQITESSFELGVFVGSALVDMYAKCGSIEDARQVFNKMHERTVVSWNAMIAGYVHEGLGMEALKLFEQMQQEGVKPNNVTFISILKACASLAALERGKHMHAHIMKSCIELDVCVKNTLVDMYAKCGGIEDAFQVFNKMHDRNVISWNAMIAGYAQQGFGKEALTLFVQMQREGIKPDEVTFVCVLTACSHAGLVDEGCYHFESMSQDHAITPTTDHYACMVDLLGRAGHLDEAEEFINRMPIQPGVTVWMALLGACRTHGHVGLGRRVFECVFELEPNCAGAHVLLANIYAAVGRWDEIAKIRKEMEDAGV